MGALFNYRNDYLEEKGLDLLCMSGQREDHFLMVKCASRWGSDHLAEVRYRFPSGLSESVWHNRTNVHENCIKIPIIRTHTNPWEFLQTRSPPIHLLFISPPPASCVSARVALCTLFSVLLLRLASLFGVPFSGWDFLYLPFGPSDHNSVGTITNDLPKPTEWCTVTLPSSGPHLT